MKYLVTYKEHSINEGVLDKVKSFFASDYSSDDKLVKDIIDNHEKIVDIRRDKSNYTTFLFNYDQYGVILSVTFTNASKRESEDEYEMMMTNKQGGKYIKSKYLEDLYSIIKKKYGLK